MIEQWCILQNPFLPSTCVVVVIITCIVEDVSYIFSIYCVKIYIKTHRNEERVSVEEYSQRSTGRILLFFQKAVFQELVYMYYSIFLIEEAHSATERDEEGKESGFTRVRTLLNVWSLPMYSLSVNVLAVSICWPFDFIVTSQWMFHLLALRDFNISIFPGFSSTRWNSHLLKIVFNEITLPSRHTGSLQHYCFFLCSVLGVCVSIFNSTGLSYVLCTVQDARRSTSLLKSSEQIGVWGVLFVTIYNIYIYIYKDTIP